MLRLFLFLLFLAFSPILSAQEKPYSFDRSITSDGIVQWRFEFNENPQFFNPEQNAINFSAVPGMAPSINPDYPALPFLSFSVLGEYQNVLSRLHVVGETYTLIFSEIKLENNHPATKSRNNKLIHQIEGPENGNLFPATIFEDGGSFNYRGNTGHVIRFFPFRYDAQDRRLEIITKIIFQFIPEDSNPELKNIPPSLLSFARSIFPTAGNLRSSGQLPDDKMLIITPEIFSEQMLEYSREIENKGIYCFIELINSETSTEEIQSVIQSYYNSHQISSVLLAGDSEQIPTPLIDGSAADPLYGCAEGNDLIPDIMIGRFSAGNHDELQVQINKSLKYSNTQTTDLNYYSRFIAQASDLGPGDNNQYDYEHLHEIALQLSQNGYSNYFEFYDGSQGDQDLPGNPTAAEVAQAVNSGAGLWFYTGHGNVSGFTSGQFGVNEAAALDNNGMYPILLAAGCQTGRFNGSFCLAEALMRAGTAEQPTGTVACWMASNDQSWSPPMAGQDEFARIVSEAESFNNYTIGSLCLAASMKMFTDYGEPGLMTALRWNLFGDASLLFRKFIPQSISTSIPESIYINETYFSFTCENEGATVVVKQNNEIIASGNVENGLFNSEINPLFSFDSLHVYISGSAWIPFHRAVAVIPSENAWLILESYLFSSSGDSRPQIGTEQTLFIRIKNAGQFESGNMHVTIQSDEELQIQSESEFEIPGIQSGELYELQLVCAIENGYLNRTPVCFSVQVSGDSQNSEFNFCPLIKSPEPQINYSGITEISGNGNGRADPGEIIALNIQVINRGEAATENASLLALTNFSGIIADNLINIPVMQAQDFFDAELNIEINEQVQAGSAVPFSVYFQEPGYPDSLLVYLNVGQRVEDAESADFSNFPWINQQPYGWIISDDNSFSGNYCFESSQIPDNNQATLELAELSMIVADSISFYFRCSSEPEYDRLEFYDGNMLLFSASGEQSWQRQSFAVLPGLHSFKWVYAKDAFLSGGADKVAIDEIVIPAGVFSDAGISGIMNNQFTIFPNPGSGLFTINSSKALSGHTYQVLDISGRLVSSGKLPTGNSANLDLRFLEAGIYLMVFQERSIEPVRLIISGK